MSIDDKKTLDDIRELEELAAEVLSIKNKSIPRRPIVIEFCGSPKSGKTSCINSLALFLRRNHFRTIVLSERAGVCPIESKHDPYFNIWTMSSAIAELSEVLSNESKHFDVVIMDRGIFDALCWFSWLLNKCHLEVENHDSLVSYLTMNKWRAALDLVYVFVVDPSESLKREYATLLTRKPGRIMHEDVLGSYRDTVHSTVAKFGGLYRKVQMFDTSQKRLNDVNYSVTKSILNILHETISEQIGYIPKSKVKGGVGDAFCFKDAINPSLHMRFGPRPTIENNEKNIQPIPILVVTNTEKNKVLIVKKNKSQTSGRSPESDKLLIYLGGHVREEDSFETRKKDVVSVCRIALNREIKEEAGIDFVPPATDTNPLCFWVKSNSRSEQHLAICFVMEANFDSMKINIDGNEFVKGGPMKSGKVVDIKDVLVRFNELEDWGKLIVSNIFGYEQPPGAQAKLL